MEGSTAKITLGITPGYFHNNEMAVGEKIPDFYEDLHKFLEEEFKDGFPSFLIHPAKVVYNRQWGCPVGGEDVYVLETDYTEYDGESMSWYDWTKKVRSVAEELKKRYKQSTVRISYYTSTVVILK